MHYTLCWSPSTLNRAHYIQCNRNEPHWVHAKTKKKQKEKKKEIETSEKLQSTISPWSPQTFAVNNVVLCETKNPEEQKHICVGCLL